MPRRDHRRARSRRPSTRSPRSRSPTATSRGRPATTPTRGTSSRRRWRSTSAAGTTRPSAPTSGCARCSAPTARGTRTTVGREVKDPTLDTNVTGYIANGVWHHYLSHRRHRVPRGVLAVVERAIDYVLDAPDARPARSRGGPTTPPTARCSPARRASTRSLRCAIADRRAARPRAPRLGAVARLRSPSRSRTGPTRFLDKDRWAMDWYYPILGGVLRGHAAARARRRRLGARSSSRAAACAASPTGRGSPRRRRASS